LDPRDAQREAGAVSEEAPLLQPKFDYHLDESDPDVLVLRRQDCAFVAAFSARGATKEGIVEAAKRDYAALLREHAVTLGLEDEAHRSRSA
jgi:hypothetical protein